MSSSGQNLDDRVSTFFLTSPNLVNVGGLGVADVPNLSAEESVQIAYDEMRHSNDNSDEDDGHKDQGLKTSRRWRVTERMGWNRAVKKLLWTKKKTSHG